MRCSTISRYQGCTLPSTQSEVSSQPSRKFNVELDFASTVFGEACHTCLQLFEASQPNSQDQTPQRRSQHRLGEACRFLRHAHGRMQHQNMLAEVNCFSFTNL